MRISGFSFVRNGEKLYYPIVESISSILDIVDEFVVAVGKGDSDDETRQRIAAIGDSKVRIIDTVWDEAYFKGGIINAMQTDMAKEACRGDWLFYLQADEVVHEKYLPAIQSRCTQLLENDRVEGLLFRYKHFWGDYEHYHAGHGWYPREIRIIRNDPAIHSWQSAQSFRRFDYYNNPRQTHGHHKLHVARVDAEIYHYGWVRPPHLMQQKRRALHTVHWGIKRTQKTYDHSPMEFDYGPLDRLAAFKGSHPRVMENMISRMDWKDKLQHAGRPDPSREPHKHERFKYRLLTFLERYLCRGEPLGEFRNYVQVDDV